jgi:single-stranded-DNA-specific exonuclease
MAAGLTLRPADIPEFRAFLCERLADEMRVASAEEAIDIDVLAAPSSARDLLGAFEALAPFGPGNPEPVYAMPDVRCENAMVVRGGHVRVSLRDARGGRLKAIAWRAEGGPLGDRLLAGAGTLHLVGKLKRDDWNGADGAQFEIEDGADPRRV